MDTNGQVTDAPPAVEKPTEEKPTTGTLHLRLFVRWKKDQRF